MVQTTSLEERVGLNSKDVGVVISGTTGSGKSRAYLVPLLSTLSDSRFMRQRIRVGAEEMVGDTTEDLLDRVAVVTSPVVLRSSSRKQMNKRGGAIATGASLATLGKSGNIKNPLALIVVPTRELGIQTAMLCYQLVGGSIKDDPNELTRRANMFKYKGPKGIRIACVLDDHEASCGLKLQTDIAITTPQYLGKLIDDGDIDPSKLRVAVYDEVDLALEQTDANDLSKLFDDDPAEREYSRLAFLVGASVTEALGSLAVRSRGKQLDCHSNALWGDCTRRRRTRHCPGRLLLFSDYVPKGKPKKSCAARGWDCSSSCELLLFVAFSFLACCPTTFFHMCMAKTWGSFFNPDRMQPVVS